MKHAFSVLFVLSAFIFSSSIAFAATMPAKKAVIKKNVTVTSTNCAGSLERLRVLGLQAMMARRDKDFARAKLLSTEKARQQAKKKAQDAFAAEMKVAAKQLEATKALCKESAPKK